MGDKYLAHGALGRLGLASPPSWLPEDLPTGLRFPVAVKAREGFGSRHIYVAKDRRGARVPPRSHAGPVVRPVLVPRRGVLDRRLLRLLGRLPERDPANDDRVQGRRIDQGHDDQGLGADRARAPRRRGAADLGPANIQCFREEDGSLLVTDVNPRFGGAFPLPLAAGSRYPELAVALASGERPEPTVGEFREGVVMTRFFSDLCLTEGSDGRLEPVRRGSSGTRGQRAGGGMTATTERPRTQPDPEPEREVDFSRYLDALVARWWLPVAGLIVGAAIGYFLALGGKDVYRAQATVYVGTPLGAERDAAAHRSATNPNTVGQIARGQEHAPASRCRPRACPSASSALACRPVRSSPAIRRPRRTSSMRSRSKGLGAER